MSEAKIPSDEVIETIRKAMREQNLVSYIRRFGKHPTEQEQADLDTTAQGLLSSLCIDQKALAITIKECMRQERLDAAYVQMLDYGCSTEPRHWEVHTAVENFFLEINRLEGRQNLTGADVTLMLNLLIWGVFNMLKPEAIGFIHKGVQPQLQQVEQACKNIETFSEIEKTLGKLFGSEEVDPSKSTLN